MYYCKLHDYNSWPVSDIYCLQKTFANNLDPDQAQQINWWYFLKTDLEKVKKVLNDFNTVINNRFIQCHKLILNSCFFSELTANPKQ